MQYKVKYSAPSNRFNPQMLTMYMIVFIPTIIMYYFMNITGAIIGCIGGFILSIVVTSQGLIIDTETATLQINPNSLVPYLKKSVNMREILSMSRNFERGQMNNNSQRSWDINLVTKGDPVIISFSSKKSVQEFESKFIAAMGEIGINLE